MKHFNEKIIFVLIFAVMGLASYASGNSDKVVASKVKSITGDVLVVQNSGREKDKVLIIDVRPAEQYSSGHISNAINILWSEIESNISRIKDWKDKPVIVYCNTGNKSAQAAQTLLNNGFTNVSNAAGVKNFKYELVTYTDIFSDTLIKMSKEADVLLVDYRPAEMYKEGHIKGAINIPVGTLNANLDKLPKDKKIVFYCNTGTKSLMAAKALSEKGPWKKVYNSIIGTKEYNYNLVK